ncbi:hypothetical protein [Moraxella lacunata]
MGLVAGLLFAVILFCHKDDLVKSLSCGWVFDFGAGVCCLKWLFFMD